MIKPIIAAIGAASLLGACASQPQQALTAPPPPAVATAQSPAYLLFFDWDRATLTPQAMTTIREAAAAYKATGGARITDIGNTDTSGASDYNMGLSVRRADAVKNALIQNGVPASAIVPSGRGETSLLVQTAVACASRRTAASSWPACRARSRCPWKSSRTRPATARR